MVILVWGMILSENRFTLFRDHARTIFIKIAR